MRRQSGRAWPWLLLLAIAGGGGWYAWDRTKAAAPPVAGKPAGKAAFAKGAGAPIPVVAVPAQRADLDVYLTGLGTVTPLRTVTVRSRAEGQLMRVHFDEGQMVREGQLLAEIDPRAYEAQVKQAEGQLARDQALLANARLDVERYRLLLTQDSIAKQQVDAQETLVRQYEGVVRVDQGQLDNARLQLSYTRITSPISGRAGLRLVDPGNIVRPGDAAGIVVVTQLAPISVLYTLPQDELPAVLKRRQDDKAVPVEAWDRELKQKLASGSLAAVDNQIDTATGTVKLKASFANSDGALFPNQFVNVRMKLQTLSGVTVIPGSAIQRGSQGIYVYVVKDDQRVSARVVKLGQADGGRTQVTEGLAPGEIVVTDGIDRLRDGARVALTQRPEIKVPLEGAARKGGARRKPAAAK
ncbi:MAG: MdtA/MuxA family multidrug efflux RND transporter periplasmic adaptor subunit [Burkholderiales bacterium]